MNKARLSLVGLNRQLLLLILSLCVAMIPRCVAAAEDMGSPAVAIFAGGCFWCMEKPFDELEGVISTTSGYTGGSVTNPSYEQVSSGTTGHAESVKIEYDPKLVSYEQLLDVYWHNIDPLDAGGQFCDRGNQYRSEIFYLNAEQEAAAIASKQQVANELHSQIATQIEAATEFFPAEDYHQNYYQKNPVRYHFYRYTCGRDGRLDEVWSGTQGYE